MINFFPPLLTIVFCQVIWKKHTICAINKATVLLMMHLYVFVLDLMEGVDISLFK